MTALAHFIMRGPSQAALAAAGFALLSLLLPLFGILGVAAVALVTLRHGARPGLEVMLIATLGAGVLAWLSLGTPWPVLGLLLAMWLPVWGLALLLRHARALSPAVQAAGALGLALVLLIQLVAGDLAPYWSELLEPMRQSLVQEAGVDEAASLTLFASLARWMTGALIAALILQLLLGLFVARWWQAALFNPGGFGEEFRALRLSRATGILTLVLLAAFGFLPEAAPLFALLLLLGSLLLLQGLAVIHALHRLRQGHVGWLVGLYILLVVMMPQATLVVAGTGLIDIWADFRARAARRLSGRK